MKLQSKVLIIIILIISLYAQTRYCYAISTYEIKFNINEKKYKENFVSEYKQIEINNIAPGVEGDFIINLSNSKQNIKYYLSFYNEKNKPNNMKFYYNQKKYNSLQELNNSISGTLNKNEEKIIKIKYLWNYETGKTANEIEKNDEIDTLDNNKTFKFNIELKYEIDKLQSKENIKGKKQNPKTGDNITIFIILLIASIICFVLITLKRKSLTKMV